MIRGGHLTMNRRFEIYRRFGHRFVPGWLAPEVLEILAVLDSLQRSVDGSGAVAEIGVHHGRLFIGLNLLQGGGGRSVAIDLFDDQALNIDRSGKGDLAKFRRNLQRWSSLEGVVIHRGDSTQLRAEDLQKFADGSIRLFSVDGGHTDPIVFSDMNLAESVMTPSGVIIADDVFNQEWPGVSTGTIRYIQQSDRQVPFAIGFNKVFFSSPEYAVLYQHELQSHFERRYLTSVKSSEFADHRVFVIARVPRRPRQLAARSDSARRIYHWVQRLCNN